MSAGRDVERLIATWLVEESPGRAPDRILEATAQTIDRTKQRRFAAAWREPMSISMRGLAAMAAILLLAVVGAGWIGRSTASVGTQPSPGLTSSQVPTSSPTPTAIGMTLGQYHVARDAICTPATAQVIALNDQGAKLHPLTNPADVPPFITNLAAIIALGSDTIDRLATLDPPAVIAAEHTADLTHHRDSLAVLNEALTKLRDGDVATGLAMTDATRPLSSLEEAFEQQWGLAGCP